MGTCISHFNSYYQIALHGGFINFCLHQRCIKGSVSSQPRPARGDVNLFDLCRSGLSKALPHVLNVYFCFMGEVELLHKRFKSHLNFLYYK